MDDLVYHGGLVAFHKNQLDRRAEDMPLNNVALYHLLNVGGWDMDTIDKPWDKAYRGHVHMLRGLNPRVFPLSRVGFYGSQTF